MLPIRVDDDCHIGYGGDHMMCFIKGDTSGMETVIIMLLVLVINLFLSTTCDCLGGCAYHMIYTYTHIYINVHRCVIWNC